VELNSGNLGSQCEAVIAVLQGLMSSEVELVPGGVTGDVTGLELAEVCQQSHVSVTGRNSFLVAPEGWGIVLTMTKSIDLKGFGMRSNMQV